MEAKDTVMSVGRHNESVYCPHCGEEFGIESKVEYEREMQAEISFKAGKQEGIREVVEWLIPHTRINWRFGILQTNLDAVEWQSKLREWEMKQPTAGIGAWPLD